MPIRPELRPFYGAAHRAYRKQMIAIFGARCMKCGRARCMKCGRDCERYLNLAHTHHDPKEWELVALWCPSCHAKHDAPHAYAVRRRTHAKKVGQLWLLPELKFAAAPAWAIPRRVIAAAQGRLF